VELVDPLLSCDDHDFLAGRITSETVEDVVEQLRRLGMSGYEAKAYLALVSADHPLNGYEVAKLSGVPRSTVYETLSKLVGRSAAFEVRADDSAAVAYVPLPPSTLFGRIRDETEDAIERLRIMLEKLAVRQSVHYTHSLPTRLGVIGRCQDLIASARSDILLLVWPEDYRVLEPSLRRAEKDGVDIATVIFGREEHVVGRAFEHIFASGRDVMGDLGCRLVVLVSDREAVVVAGLLEDEAWGVFTDDPAVVMLAGEFIFFDMTVQGFVDYIGPERLAEWKRERGNDLAFLRTRATPATLLRRLSAAEPPPPAPRATGRRPRRTTG
jgi:sugar-specific transcriptional regulator TrmB